MITLKILCCERDVRNGSMSLLYLILIGTEIRESEDIVVCSEVSTVSGALLILSKV